MKMSLVGRIGLQRSVQALLALRLLWQIRSCYLLDYAGWCEA